MRQQRGMSLIGFVLVAIIGALLAIVGFRIAPIVTEYLTIKRIMKNVTNELPPEATPYEIRRRFSVATAADYVNDIAGTDLDISKEAGNIVISADYNKKVPLFMNVSLLFEFHPSSRK